VSSSGSYQSGDVVWAPDPFRDSGNPRLWLVLVSDGVPYSGEDYICVALTTSDLPANLEVGDAWITGQHPGKTSYCSPWVLATIKHDDIANPQGQVTAAFTDRVRAGCIEYLSD